MSAFYDQASLVVVPSGYKSGKIYAQKPLTTDGQLTFTRASTATRVNASGLIEEVASGVPRLDYLGSSCPKLLLEPQRTNLALNNTTDIGTTTGGEGTVITGPDGNLTGRRPIPDSNARRFEFTYGVGTFSTGAVVTYSWFVKVVGTPANPSPTTGQVDFSQPVNNTPGTPYKVADYADGWERWAVACTIIDGAVATRIRVYYGSIIGIGNDAIAYHGHQIEVGTYPTSVIYTLSTSVTRVAEAANLATIPSSTATSFTIFTDWEYMNASNAIYSFRNSSNALSYVFYYFDGKWDVFNGAAFITNFNITAKRGKIAIVHTPSTVKVFINGADNTKAGASPSASLSQKINFAPVTIQDAALNSLLYIPSALTDSQAIELTTL
jgi:hypothetical protein